MAVAFSAVGPAGGGGSSWVSGNTFSWTHPGGGSDTALTVFVNVGLATTDAGWTLTADAAGTAMADAGTGHVHTNAGGHGFLQCFKLANPPTGSVTVTITGVTSGGTPVTADGASVSFTGGSTFGTAVGLSSPSDGTDATATVTAATTSQVMAGVASGATLSTTVTGTQRYLDNHSIATGAGCCEGQTAAGTGSSQTLHFTLNGTDQWATIAVEVIQATAAGTPGAPQAFPQMRTEYIHGGSGGRIIRT